MREPLCGGGNGRVFHAFFVCAGVVLIWGTGVWRKTQAHNLQAVAQLHNIIFFSVYGELYAVDIDQVTHFQADDHYTHVYYSTGAHFMIPFGLSKVEAAIGGCQPPCTHLVRLGRKFIVNTRRIFHINTIKQVVILTDDHGTNITLHLPKHILRDLIDTLNSAPPTNEPE